MLAKVLQVAGHEGAMASDCGQMFIKPNCRRQELEFYEKLANNEELASVTWPCYGTLTKREFLDAPLGAGGEKLQQQLANGEAVVLKSASQADQVSTVSKDDGNGNTDGDKLTLVLENALCGFKEPSVMDVKLGKRLWDESADDDKRARLDRVSETTTSGSHHMRICGMSVYNPKAKQRVAYGKEYGRGMKPDGLVDGFDGFFSPMFDIDMKRAVCEVIVQQLEYIYHVLSKQEIRLISSSLLFVYESNHDAFEQKLELQDQDDDYEVEENDEGEEIPKWKLRQLYNVKLIDFGHSKFVPGQGPDENILTGVKALIDVFRELEKRCA